MHMAIQQNVKFVNAWNYYILAMYISTCFIVLQVSRNPRNIAGYGLSDGEVVERLWAYLRRFASMTKEMRPSHRIDVLSDAIKHYARWASLNIGM